MPRIVLRNQLTFADLESGFGMIIITVSNPKDVAIQIQLTDICSGTETESSQEIDLVYTINPPLQVPALQLQLRSNSPIIDIGAFEDELLIEDENSGGSVSVASAPCDDWHVTVAHNVANISIPVQVVSQPNAIAMVPVVSELSIVVKVKDNLVPLTLGQREWGGGPLHSMSSSSATVSGSFDLSLYTKILIVT